MRMVYLPVYPSIEAHPKLFRLATELEVDLDKALGLLVRYWLFSLRQAPRTGQAPGGLTDLQLDLALRSGERSFARALRVAGFRDDDGSPHDWEDWVGCMIEAWEAKREDAKTRMRKIRMELRPQAVTRTLRERSANVRRTVTRTLDARSPDPYRPDPSRSDPIRPRVLKVEAGASTTSATPQSAKARKAPTDAKAIALAKALDTPGLTDTEKGILRSCLGAVPRETLVSYPLGIQPAIEHWRDGRTNGVRPDRLVGWWTQEIRAAHVAAEEEARRSAPQSQRYSDEAIARVIEIERQRAAETPEERKAAGAALRKIREDLEASHRKGLA